MLEGTAAASGNEGGNDCVQSVCGSRWSGKESRPNHRRQVTVDLRGNIRLAVMGGIGLEVLTRGSGSRNGACVSGAMWETDLSCVDLLPGSVPYGICQRCLVSRLTSAHVRRCASPRGHWRGPYWLLPARRRDVRVSAVR